MPPSGYAHDHGKEQNENVTIFIMLYECSTSTMKLVLQKCHICKTAKYLKATFFRGYSF